jgi:hypothetical protein
MDGSAVDRKSNNEGELLMNATSSFCCYLDGQPDHLTPEHQLRNFWSEELAGHPLFINNDCLLTDSGAVPHEIASHTWLTDGFASMQNMAWIRDSVTGALQPFWLDSQMQSALTAMRNGTPETSLDEYRKRSLAIARVLVPDSSENIQQKKLLATFSRCADQIQRQGYTPVAGLIHPFHISALRRYYRNMVRTGKMELGDTQSSRRYRVHNESVARFFHFQLSAAVSAIVGQPVKPSYVYFASYQGGAFLEKHTDRSQCEFSITFCLDYSPEPQGHTPWPIQLHTTEGITTVYQSIGDALVYRGCQLPHSRGVLPLGHTSTSIFFHYVPEDFEGSLN